MQPSLSERGANQAELLSPSLQQLILSSPLDRSSVGERADLLVTSLRDPNLSEQLSNLTIGLDPASCLGLSAEALDRYSNQDLLILLVLDSAVFPSTVRPSAMYALLAELSDAATLTATLNDKISLVLATRLKTLVRDEDNWRRAPTADVSEVQTILSILARREDLRRTSELQDLAPLQMIQTVLWPCFEQRNRLNLEEQTNQIIRHLYPRDDDHHTGISAVLRKIHDNRTYAGVLRFSELQALLYESNKINADDVAKVALMMLTQKFYDGVINRTVSEAVNELLLSCKEAVPCVIRDLSKDLKVDSMSQITTSGRVEYEIPRLYHSAKVIVEASRKLVAQGHAESSYLKQAIPALIVHLVISLDSNVFRSAKADLFAAVSELPVEWLTQKQLFVLGQKLFRDSGAGMALAGKLAGRKLLFGGLSSSDKT